MTICYLVANVYKAPHESIVNSPVTFIIFLTIITMSQAINNAATQAVENGIYTAEYVDMSLLMPFLG